MKDNMEEFKEEEWEDIDVEDAKELDTEMISASNTESKGAVGESLSSF